MKKNKNNKKNCFNKIIYISFLFFITSIFFSKVLDFKYSEIIRENVVEESLATNKSNLVEYVDGELVYIGPDIRILEIEPADSFKLTDILNTRVTTGRETVIRYVNNKDYKIEITHMTMAEFIGKTEKINGKYDVIVIGRYVDEDLFLSKGDIVSSLFNKYYNMHGMTWFRDYENLNNDITNKKANEIKDFIDSGQLVYIDKDIENMSSSKIYYHTVDKNGCFNQTSDNLIKNFSISSNNDITIDSILTKYIERIDKEPLLKRPNIFSTLPEEDSIDDKLGDISNRNMEFNIYSNDLENENVNIKLYLDLNGDTLFKNEEIVKELKDINITKDGYKLEYNIYEDHQEFIGYLNWRIEVEKNILDGYSTAIKSYFDGSTLFRRLTEEKKVINVLQITHLSRGDLDKYYTNYENNGIGTSIGTGLSLTTDTQFQNLLSQKEVNDYEVNIDIINYTDLYNHNSIDGWMKSKYADIFNYVNNVKLSESKYSVIIIGFNSNYDTGQLSEKAVEELKEYTAEGKSLILTHDTVSTNAEDISQASNFVKVFRDTIGQSRYLDPNNETSNYTNHTSIGINGNMINHDSDNTQDIFKKRTSETLLSIPENYGDSTKVFKINNTILTSYPFKLDDEIEVKITNHQQFQLNLEDENVVPMLNLTEYNNNVPQENLNLFINRYDSRNAYYAYSKDNITFSSIGETERGNTNEYSIDELKLFVNTIIKSDREVSNKKNNNNKPQITGLEDCDGIPYGEDFKFNIVVKDIDNDKVRLNKILVDGQDITKDNNISDEYKDSGVTYNLFIKSSLLSKENTEITITLEAEDEKGEKSIKEYRIKVIYNKEEEVVELQNGLYEKVTSEGEVIINKGQFEFAAGSNINFGVSVKTVNNNLTLYLDIDKKFYDVIEDNIKVYITNKGKIQEISNENKVVDNLGDNKFKITINNFNYDYNLKNILIIYNGAIKEESENESFVNEARVGNISKDINIITSSSSNEGQGLPDLF